MYCDRIAIASFSFKWQDVDSTAFMSWGIFCTIKMVKSGLVKRLPQWISAWTPHSNNPTTPTTLSHFGTEANILIGDRTSPSLSCGFYL